MAAEIGHAANRVYTAQDGSFHLNGASLFDANEVDQKAALNAIVAGVAAGYKVARGVATTATASDDINTGLTTVVAAVACLEDAPGLDPYDAQAVVGDQAGAPAAGHILLKTWKFTGATNPTPLAATTFAKKVSWIAIGV